MDILIGIFLKMGRIMTNHHLVYDYLLRSEKRLAAIELLFKEESWPDVVRESQSVVELTLKALLREFQIATPRIHDVSTLLLENTQRLPQDIQPHVEKMAAISKNLRRDRELAFYGSEDITPSEFYTEKDAKEAKEAAKLVFSYVYRSVAPRYPRLQSKKRVRGTFFV